MGVMARSHPEEGRARAFLAFAFAAGVLSHRLWAGWSARTEDRLGASSKSAWRGLQPHTALGPWLVERSQPPHFNSCALHTLVADNGDKLDHPKLDNIADFVMNNSAGRKVVQWKMMVPCNGGTECCDREVFIRSERHRTDFFALVQCLAEDNFRILYKLLQGYKPRYILDAGGNAGYASLFFASMWPDAKIVAVKPDPGNYKNLKKNLRARVDLEGAGPRFHNVRTVNAGVWTRSARLAQKAGDFDWGKVFGEAEEGQEGLQAYSILDLARMHNIKAFDFVKLDIEGSEGMVFAPGTDVSWMGGASLITMELHDGFGKHYGLREGEIYRRVSAAFNASLSGWTVVTDQELWFLVSDALRPFT